MLRHAFAHRQSGLPTAGVVRQRRNVSRWRRWRRAQDVFQNPLSAQHRRCPIGIGSHGENASLPEQPAAHAVRPSVTRLKWLP